MIYCNTYYSVGSLFPLKFIGELCFIVLLYLLAFGFLTPIEILSVMVINKAVSVTLIVMCGITASMKM